MKKFGSTPLGQSFFIVIVIAFIFGGTGLGILYNYGNDFVSIIGGFTLIGVAVAIIYRLMN